MLKNFFWVKTWLSVHGLFVFKKLSIFITILFLLNYLLNKIEIKKIFQKPNLDKRIIILIFFSLFCSVIWFLRYPVFRYGSSYLAVLIVSIFTYWAMKYELILREDKKFKQLIRASLILFSYFLV